MDDAGLDEIDHSILHALQKDARHRTNSEIGERAGVSASTVGKRISRLEEHGVVKGYRPESTTSGPASRCRCCSSAAPPIAEREALIRNTLGVDGVVNIRELMTGERNVHILVVGSSNDDITQLARTIDGLGYTVNDELLMRSEYDQPSVQFEAAAPTR